jgi:putative oxidoreductase
MNRLVTLGFVPRGYDLALLVLRVWFGVSLFLRHGLPKIAGFSHLASHFSDPLHIGSRNSLALAALAEGICSLLLILGLGTRWAALIIAIDVGVAFSMIHKFHLLGQNSGEFAWLYLGSALALLIAGGGRFSLDGKE